MNIHEMLERTFPPVPFGLMRESCLHPTAEIRIRRNAKGWTYWKQCLVCGFAVGTAIAKNAVSSVGIKDWDDSIASPAPDYEAERRARDEWRLARNAYFWELYNTYLQSAEWRTLRQLVLDRDGAWCQSCLLRPANEVHHKTYKHVGHEAAFEVVSLCHDCHMNKLHADKQERNAA